MTQPCQSCSGRATVYLCSTCVGQLRALLNSLVTGPVVTARPDGSPVRSSGLLEDLADVILRRTKLGDGSGGGHRKRGDDNPGLYEPDTENGKRTRQAEAVMLLDAINNGLSTIVRDLCESRGIGVWRPLRTVERDFIGPLMPGWRRLPVGYVASSLDRASWLAANVGAIACDEAAGQWHGEIAGYVRRIELCIDRPLRRRWLGPCPTWDEQVRKACGTDLYAREDAIEVYCRKCRATHNCNRLQLLQQGDLERERLTWDRLLKANKYQPDEFRIPERTLRLWRKTGPNGEPPRLKPRGWLRPDGSHGINRRTNDDEPLYLWSDVRKLRVEKPQKAATGAAAHKSAR